MSWVIPGPGTVETPSGLLLQRPLGQALPLGALEFTQLASVWPGDLSCCRRQGRAGDGLPGTASRWEGVV